MALNNFNAFVVYYVSCLTTASHQEFLQDNHQLDMQYNVRPAKHLSLSYFDELL